METMELEPDEFWRMVTESHLQVDGPSAGYMWTGKQGVTGWEMYKSRANPIGWLYQGARVNTQSAGGGGALTTNVVMPTGTVGMLVMASVIGTASAGSSLDVQVLDEDGLLTGRLASIAAGTNRTANLPSPGAAATTTGNVADSAQMFIGPGQTLSFITSAALQTETLSVRLVLLMSRETQPTWNTTGSAGTPTLAASTISAANTLQAVYLWPR